MLGDWIVRGELTGREHVLCACREIKVYWSLRGTDNTLTEQFITNNRTN